MNAEDEAVQAPKRIVRTITLTEEDLARLDAIERVISSKGQRIKTDSKLIRASISIAHASLLGEDYDLGEVAARVLQEDGRTRSRLLREGGGGLKSR